MATPPAPGPPAGRAADAPTAGAGGSRDLAALGLLLALSLAVHGWIYAHTSTTARDSIGFAQLALQYESPEEAIGEGPYRSQLDVLRRGVPPHPPGYPAMVLAASKVVRAAEPGGDLPWRMLRSTQVASIVAAALLVFPCYALGRLLFGRFVAFAATALFQLLPVAAHVTADGLTEAWYLLLLLTSIAFGTWGVKRPRAAALFAAGLASGGAYLVRPEGLQGALAVLAVLAWRFLADPPARGTLARGAVLVLLGAALLAGPYMLAVGGVTLKPGGRGVIELQPVAAAAGGPLFGASYSPSEDGALNLWVLSAMFKESFKAFHYAAWFYALAGVVLTLLRVRREPWLGVPLALFFGNTLLITVLASRANYLSERHTLAIVLVGCFFAAHAMEELSRLLRTLPGVGPVLGPPYVKWVVLAAVCASCLPQTLKPLHENRAGHRKLGEYLREHAGPDDVVIDPYNWAQYYSGRSLRGVPADPAQATVRWAIVEEGELPHSTLTRLALALAVRDDKANPPTVAASWVDPADVRKSRRITLYRQEVK